MLNANIQGPNLITIEPVQVNGLHKAHGLQPLGLADELRAVTHCYRSGWSVRELAAWFGLRRALVQAHLNATLQQGGDTPVT